MNKIILSIILSISLLNIGVLHSNDSYKSRKIFNIPEKNNFNDDKLDNKKSNDDSSNNNDKLNDDKKSNENSLNDDKFNEKESNLYNVYESHKVNLSNEDLKKINDNLDYLISNKSKYDFIKKMWFYFKFKTNNFLSIFKKNHNKIISKKEKFNFQLNKNFDIVPINNNTLNIKDKTLNKKNETLKKVNNINVNNETFNLNDKTLDTNNETLIKKINNINDKYKEYKLNKKEFDSMSEINENFDFNNFFNDYSEYFNQKKPIIESYKDLKVENINQYTLDPNDEYMFMDYESKINSYYDDFEKEENSFYENKKYDNKSKNYDLSDINDDIINNDFFEKLRKEYEEEKYHENDIDMESYKEYEKKEINEQNEENQPCCCVPKFFIKLIELINERDDFYKKQEKNMIEQYKKNNVVVIK
ncbi:MAG: hypothetical protein NHF86_01260 [Candidatus Bostrichicola ureolyticus]|nr:MAG: hypothetical protein NHF86_01260 [Candidatus Bostrichicola ureolyticus]